MKRILLVAAGLCLGLAAWAAPTLITKTYPIDDFNAIDVAGVYRVDLSLDSRCSVSIQAPDYMEPYLIVKVSDGTLRMSMEKLPVDIQRRLNKDSDKIWATVRMPSVRRMTLSGACRLACFNPIVETEPFRLTMSGAARAEGLSVEAPEARVDLSGAAKCQMSSGLFPKMTLRLSGAAKMDAGKICAEEMETDVSGASKLSMEGQVKNLQIEVSGASKAELKGEGVLDLSVQVSGASRVLAENMPAYQVKVDLSGTGFCKVHALSSIRIDASGATTCQYKAGPDTDVRILSAGRGSSISRL